jgi:hypothetical protein
VTIFEGNLEMKRENQPSCKFSFLREWSKDSWDFFHGLARSAEAAETGNQLVTLFNVSKDYTAVSYLIDLHPEQIRAS